MTKAIVFKCNLCKTTKEERLLLGIKSAIGTPIKIIAVSQAEIHICEGCIKFLNNHVERRIINGMSGSK